MDTPFSSLHRWISRFCRNRSGNISLLAAFLAVPLVLGVGSVVDYGMALTVKGKLDAAADSAALAAVNAGRTAAALNSSISSGSLTTVMQNAADKYFKAAGVTLAQNLNSSVVANKSGLNVSAQVTYTAKSRTYFLKMLGINEIDMSGGASAETGLRPYVDINVLADVSGSMGVGATLADQQILRNATGCTFGCHTAGNTGYDVGRAAGATMRIDVLRSALIAMLTEAQNVANYNIKFGIHKFSNSMQTVVNVTSSNSSDYAALKTLVTSSVVMNSTGTGTNFYASIPQFNSAITRVGDGTTANAPKSFAIIITDGTEDQRNFGSSSDGWWYRYDNIPATYPNYDGIQNINPNYCSAMKARGIELMILHVAYIVPPYSVEPNTRWHLDNIQAGLLPDTPNKLKACATDANHYYSANSPAEIHAAMLSIFNNIIKSTALVN